VKLTIADLQAMKREGRKIAAVVCWDANSAALADSAGAEIVSVGDSAASDFDELLVYCRAVRRAVSRALVSCDLPEPTVERARRLLEQGADLVKVETRVAELAGDGVPVFAQMSGGDADEARRLEADGAALIDCRYAAEGVADAVSIPVLGGLGGGPWLDGRIRAVHRLLGEPLSAYVADVRGARPVQGD
jgi:3-methyl-2-oxobutanoate hydroxymethyltransferase